MLPDRGNLSNIRGSSPLSVRPKSPSLSFNTILARSRSVNDSHFDDQYEEKLKRGQISIEDRIMELLIASKRQLKPNSRRRKRNPLALESSKIFDQEIVEKTVNHKSKEISEGKILDL